MDRKRLRRKVFFNLLSAPWTVIPAVSGASALLISWGMDLGTGWLTFLGVSGLLAGAGALATQWVFGAEELTQQAAKSLENEARQKEEDRLNQLDQRLQQDDDPRDETSLRQLRSMYQDFQQDTRWTRKLSQQSAVEIISKVDRLYRGCIATLERSLELTEAAQAMNTRKGRTGVLEAREKLLGEVKESVKQLAHTIDDVKALAIDQQADANLSRIRSELDESLEVARRVEERMHSLESELSGEHRESRVEN